MENLTPELFDTLIYAVIIVGVALAAVRLYRDLSRPIKKDEPTEWLEFDEDTRPHAPVQDTDESARSSQGQ